MNTEDREKAHALTCAKICRQAKCYKDNITGMLECQVYLFFYADQDSKTKA